MTRDYSPLTPASLPAPDDVLDALRPGRVLNVLGSDDASHAEMRALIYSATHDVIRAR